MIPFSFVCNRTRMFLIGPYFYSLKTLIRYLKNGLPKNIVHVIKHTNFQIYRIYPAGVTWKN